MNAWKTAAAAAALLIGAGAGAAFLSPAYGQTTPRAATPSRAVEVFGGRGSQIGVSVRDLEDADTRAGQAGASAGVMIEDVSTDSPASAAGMKKGDTVVEFDGERVRSVRQFTRLVQETPAGRKVQASVLRNGQRVALTIEPRESGRLSVLNDLDGARVLRDFSRDFRFDVPTPMPPPVPSAPRAVPPAPPEPPFPGFDTYVFRTGNTLGITVGELSDQLADYFGVKDGVLVTSIADNSAAAKAGLKAGDIITSFNGANVTAASELRRQIQRLQDGDEFTLGVVREKKTLSLKGKAETSRVRRTYRSVI